MALKAGLEVRFLTLAGADKIDPDLLFLERGLAAYDEVRRGALGAMAFACRAVLPAPETATPEQKAGAARQLHEIVSAAESEVARAGFIGEIAAYLKLPVTALQKDFLTQQRRQQQNDDARNAARARLPDGAAAPASGPPSASSVNTPEHHLLLLCLHFEKLGQPMATALPHDWIDTTQPAGVLLNRFLSEFLDNTWPGRDHLDALLETAEERTLVASLLFETPNIEDPVKVANEGLRQLRARALEPRLRQIELDLATHHADSKSDPISLLKERTELQKQLRQPLGLPPVV